MLILLRKTKKAGNGLESCQDKAFMWSSHLRKSRVRFHIFHGYAFHILYKTVSLLDFSIYSFTINLPCSEFFSCFLFSGSWLLWTTIVNYEAHVWKPIISINQQKIPSNSWDKIPLPWTEEWWGVKEEGLDLMNLHGNWGDAWVFPWSMVVIFLYSPKLDDTYEIFWFKILFDYVQMCLA